MSRGWVFCASTRVPARRMRAARDPRRRPERRSCSGLWLKTPKSGAGFDGRVISASEAVGANRPDVERAIQHARNYPDIVTRDHGRQQTQVFWSGQPPSAETVIAYIREIRARTRDAGETPGRLQLLEQARAAPSLTECDFVFTHPSAALERPAAERGRCRGSATSPRSARCIPIAGRDRRETSWATMHNDQGNGASS